VLRSATRRPANASSARIASSLPKVFNKLISHIASTKSESTQLLRDKFGSSTSLNDLVMSEQGSV
jgi:hypothetical protein